MDVQPEGHTYVERYGVNDYPHIGIIDPRTGRLLWRKEGWTQENPLRSEVFAEMAMDFCSRNTFDKPPQAPRLGASGTGAPRAQKRPMHEMSEEDQLQAAMRASMHDLTSNGAKSNDMDEDDEVEVMKESKPAATADVFANPNEALLSFTVGDEPDSGPRIQLRMPDGKRIVRRFRVTDTLRTMYAFLAVRT